MAATCMHRNALRQGGFSLLPKVERCLNGTFCICPHSLLPARTLSNRIALTRTATTDALWAQHARTGQGHISSDRNQRSWTSQKRRLKRRTISCSYAKENVQSFEAQDVDEEQRDRDILERRQLLQRQLAVAINEENYAQAAGFRDELFKLKDSLSPLGNYLLSQADRMRQRERSREERLKAAEALARMGDQRIIKELTVGLADPDDMVVQMTEGTLWGIFHRSGSPSVDELLQKGIESMIEKKNLLQAVDIFDEVIRRAPLFAEGYNKRATAHYYLRHFRESIEDCHRSIELNPLHFGALSGLGLNYLSLQELDSALVWFQRAIDVHPGLDTIQKYVHALKHHQSQKQTNAKQHETDDESSGGVAP